MAAKRSAGLRVDVNVAAMKMAEEVEDQKNAGATQAWSVMPFTTTTTTTTTTAAAPGSPTTTKKAAAAPMSPVRLRLEKRCRSPAARNAKTKAMRSPEAKKRRDELLIAQVRENSRKVARAKAIARRRSQERERARRELAAHIEAKLRAAEARRMRILDDIKERARRADAPASPTSGEVGPGEDASSSAAAAEDLKTEPSSELEARISEAEERRAVEYERKLAQVREHLARVRETCDRLRMTRRVQAWWRRTASERAALEDLGPLRTIVALAAAAAADQGHSPTFEEVAAHLARPEVVAAARDFLDALRVSARRKTAPAASTPTSPSAARTFLAVLMIWHHPETVLGPDAGDNVEPTRAQLRKRLRIAARNLYKVLEGLAAALEVRSHTRAARKLVFCRHAHLAYARAFFSWKQADALCLADQLLETYVQIKENHLQVRGMLDQQGDNPDPGLLQHFEGTAGQLEEIRSRAKTVLRDKQLFRDWLARIRRRFPKPQAQDPAAASSSASAADTHSAAAAAAAKVPEVPRVAAAPSNEEMMHRLLVDPDFKLAVDDNVDDDDDDAATPAAMDADLLPAVVGEVRTRLGALTPNRADLARQLEDRLDCELLAQQVREDALGNADLYSLVQFIGERLLALQAPIRQARTEQWLMSLHVAAQERRNSWQQLAARAFGFVLRELKTIEVDMANFHLQVLRDNVGHDDGAAYLREKFTSRLDQGEYRKGPRAVAPHRTEAWFAAAAAAAAATASNNAAAAAAATTDDIVLEGMVGLLTRDEAPRPADLPETLAEFDHDDICLLRARTEAFARIAVAEMALLGKQKTHADYSRTLRALLLDPPGASLADVAENVANLAPEADRSVVKTLLAQSANLERTVTRQLAAILRKLLKDPAHNALQLLKKIALDRHAEDFHDAVVQRAHRIHALHLATHKPLFDRLQQAQ